MNLRPEMEITCNSIMTFNDMVYNRYANIVDAKRGDSSLDVWDRAFEESECEDPKIQKSCPLHNVNREYFANSSCHP